MASAFRWRAGAPLGVLDGVPISVKDLMPTKGMATLCGSRSVDPTTGAAAFYALGWNVDYREHGVESALGRRGDAGVRREGPLGEDPVGAGALDARLREIERGTRKNGPRHRRTARGRSTSEET